MKTKQKNKILLHACCGICSAYPISTTDDVVVYFFNPNIHPQSEYSNRLEAQRQVCSHFSCELIEGEYKPEYFHEATEGLETEPEKGCRCNICFELRLRETARKAKELGIDTFTTSIVISPHKDYKKITAIGKKIADEFGLNYLDIDFKKNDGFLKTNKIAKELSLHRQNYCGCKYSLP